jgi:hypothetical protein
MKKKAGQNGEILPGMLQIVARKKRSWQADPSSCNDLYPETERLS